MTAGIVAAAAVIGALLAYMAIAAMNRWWPRRPVAPPVRYQRVACRSCGATFNPLVSRGRRPVVEHLGARHRIVTVDALTHVCGTDCAPERPLMFDVAPPSARVPMLAVLQAGEKVMQPGAVSEPPLFDYVGETASTRTRPRPVDPVELDSWVVVKGDLVLGAPHFSRAAAETRRDQLDPAGLSLGIRPVIEGGAR